MGQILKQRDIILVPFLYTDQSGLKRRPAVVMSSDAFNRSYSDIIICGITSFDNGDPILLPVKKEDWTDGLWSESYVNPAYVASLDLKLVIKRIGRLRKERFDELMQKFKRIFD